MTTEKKQSQKKAATPAPMLAQKQEPEKSCFRYQEFIRGIREATNDASIEFGYLKSQLEPLVSPAKQEPKTKEEVDGVGLPAPQSALEQELYETMAYVLGLRNSIRNFHNSICV